MSESAAVLFPMPYGHPTATVVKRTALALPGQGPPEAREKEQNKIKLPSLSRPPQKSREQPLAPANKRQQADRPNGGGCTEREQRPKTNSQYHAIGQAAPLPRLVGTDQPTPRPQTAAQDTYRSPRAGFCQSRLAFFRQQPPAVLAIQPQNKRGTPCPVSLAVSF